jgi:hypothetical protein
MNSIQHMLISLLFNSFYHKLKLCFICHVYYISFSWGKGLLTVKNICLISKHTLNFFNFQVSQLLIVSVFQVWIVGCYYLNFFIIKKSLLK